MQQRQLRLGDILDDYCPRERRVTNHVVVAMIGEDVKQTRCTTCDADHAYKHAKVPRQRKKDTPALLYAQVLAGGPKRVAHEDAQEEEAVTPSNGAGPAPAAPEPPLERPALRSVSYGLHVTPPNALRSPAAYSPIFALARMMAPASRSLFTKVASSGGRSFAKKASAP